jgi:subtilase family serine protease
MKIFSVAALAVLLQLTSLVPAEIRPASGTIITPDSSIEKPIDIGMRAHTNVHILLPAKARTNLRPFGAPYSGLGYETPASLACVYGLTKAITGCSPNLATTNPTGGAKMIAIVDAYDAPNAASDLAAFSTQFGLPAANFQIVYAAGAKPAYDAGWEMEESLDVQWAHAMAPGAKIVLVEAASSSFSDLLVAEDMASQMVNAAGGGEVSNSWGGGEFPGEITYDAHFVKANVVFFASAGDGPGTIWPGASPNVVSAGGTIVRRNPATDAFLSEYPWDEAGGGASWYEPRPSYQIAVSTLSGNFRGVPDLSFDSSPTSGVWIFDSNIGGWYVAGGTSVASPSLAGIINSAGSFHASSNAELTAIYSNRSNTADFRDITAGFCGPYGGYSGASGWDFCTGVGVVNGKTGK